jgi:chromosome segregation ATPase
MGGGPSRQTLNYRKNALRRYDRYNSDIQSKINVITPIRDELRQKIDTMNDEIDQLNTDISKLGKTTTSNRKTKTSLASEKTRLEKDLKSAKYLLKAVDQAIDEITKYGNIQKRTQDFFDKEYEVLYTKVMTRQQLKQNDYINRNETLERAIKQFNQNFSNDYRNTEYQENHTAYFVTLNSQFWWVYYILCLILLYQIVYIQNEMNLKTKVILGIILTLYPLSYRIYDLVGTKK